MKGKLRLTLGKKIVIMIVAMAVTLCATALFVSYQTYQRRTTDFYTQLAHNAAATLASQLTPEELDHYYDTLEMDERYYEIQSFIMDLAASSSVEYLYVVRPHGVGVTFLFDSDMETGENGDYTSGGYCALGTYVDLVGEFADNLDNLLAGLPVEPIIQWDESYGWLMTAMVPVRHEDGTGTAFYDRTMYQAPRGDYHVFEDSGGSQWYAIPGTPAVERRPVYEDGRPVYDGDKLQTTTVETMRYKSTPSRHAQPQKRPVTERKPPNRKKP